MQKHAGVRKREKRHDYITHPRMKFVIQAGFERKTSLEDFLHRTVKPNALIPVDLARLPEKIRRVDHEVIDFTFAIQGVTGVSKLSDTGERRMNAALHKPCQIRTARTRGQRSCGCRRREKKAT